MKIAYFSPLNPERSGISDYSEELLPYLAQYADIDIFIDEYQPGNLEIAEVFEIFPARNFPALRGERRYDTCLYHMGNNSLFHGYLYPYLLKYPGVTVLHDPKLHHFFVDITLGKGNASGYIREMSYCYGPEGAELAREVVAQRCPPPFFEYSLIKRVVDASLGVIVHSQYAAELVLEANPAARVGVVNSHLSLEAPTTSPTLPEPVRWTLGLDPSQFVLASFGFISHHKRPEVALRAFARFRQSFPQAVYLMVGEAVPGFSIESLESLIQELGLERSVIVTGYVSQELFQAYMAAADVYISLRYPTAGETSASLIRTLGMGKPVIVSNIGSFAELPDDCCAKVDVNESEEDMLVEYMTRLAMDRPLRDSMGKNAQRYVQRNHTLEGSARSYIQFIAQVLAQSRAGPRCPAIQPPERVLVPLQTLPRGAERVSAELARELARLGLGEWQEPVLRDVATALKELGLGPLPAGPSPSEEGYAGALKNEEEYLRKLLAGVDFLSDFPGTLRGEIELLSPPPAGPVIPGAMVELQVAVRNTGDTLWLSRPSPTGGYVTLGTQMLDDQYIFLSDTLERTLLPYDLGPGSRVTLRHRFTAPREPGSYQVKLDLVDELATWFEEWGGAAPLLLPLGVADADPSHSPENGGAEKE